MKFSNLLLFSAFFFLGCSSDDGPDAPNLNRAATISIEDIIVDEGETDGNIFVRLQLDYTGDLTDDVTAVVNTAGATATSGVDFEAITNQEVVFTSTQKTQEVRIVIKGDTEEESDESFTLDITAVDGATIEKGTATITIKNDDGSGGSVFIPEGYSTPETYAGMELIWEDDFDGTEVDPLNWTFEIGNGSGGWGNQELQFYRKENTTIQDGNLIITAEKENFSGFNYTSSRMITKGKFDFKFGRVDIRANVPYGQGIWPALWMLGSDISSVGWPSCGEIDIMEVVGHDANTTHGTIHFSNNNGDHVYTGGQRSISSGILNDEFHVYSVIWDETSIKWLLDDVQFHSEPLTPADRSELKNNQFFIFNVAVGGLWPGSPDATTVFPQRMIVDYIRVFQ